MLDIVFSVACGDQLQTLTVGISPFLADLFPEIGADRLHVLHQADKVVKHIDVDPLENVDALLLPLAADHPEGLVDVAVPELPAGYDVTFQSKQTGNLSHLVLFLQCHDFLSSLLTGLPLGIFQLENPPYELMDYTIISAKSPPSEQSAGNFCKKV